MDFNWYFSFGAIALISSFIIGAIQSRGMLPKMTARILLAIAWLIAVFSSASYLVTGAPFKHRLIVGTLVGVPFAIVLILFEYWMTQIVRKRELAEQNTSNQTGNTKLQIIQFEVFDTKPTNKLGDAKCVAINEETKLEYSAYTRNSGLIEIQVPVGFYTVTVSAVGYSTHTEAAEVKVGANRVWIGLYPISN